MASSSGIKVPVSTLVGGGTGTTIIYFAEKMSDNNDWKYWIIVAAPTVAVLVADVGERIRKIWHQRSEERWCAKTIKMLETHKKRATSPEEIARLDRQLERMRKLQYQIRENRMPATLETFLAIEPVPD